MKKLVIALVLVLTLLSDALANRIIIPNQIIPLVLDGKNYSFPRDATVNLTMNHVYVGLENRVCFIKPIDELADLDLLILKIEQPDKKLFWFCYRYDPRYFKLGY